MPSVLMILVSPREDLLEGDLGQPTAQNFEARRGFGHVEAMRLLHRDELRDRLCRGE